MNNYQILCVGHDQNGVITHVGIKTLMGVRKCGVEKVAGWSRNNSNRFYTRNKAGKIVYVYAGANLFKEYLTTVNNGSFENELDFLPKC